MWCGHDSKGGPLCREEGKRVSHQGFGSTFVVDPEAKHGVACHCCSRDSSVFFFFISSWDGSWRFIHLLLSLVESRLQVDCRSFFFLFSFWVLWSLGCKSTADLSSSFSAFRKKTLKSWQGRRVSWPCLTPYHMHFHQGYIICLAQTHKLVFSRTLSA
jgi:hypothetical protein